MSIIEIENINYLSTEMLDLLKSVNEIDYLTLQKNNKLILVLGPKNSEVESVAQFIQRSILKKQNIFLSTEKYEIDSQIKNNAIYFDYEVDDLFFDDQKFYVLKVTSLNQRKQDLLPLSEFFIEVSCLINQTNKKILSEKAIEKINNSFWQNEISQLEQVIDQAVMTSSRAIIEPEDLKCLEKPQEVQINLGQKLEYIERQYILQTLYFVEQNRTKAAEVLGISIRTLRNKLNQYRQEGYL